MKFRNLGFFLDLWKKLLNCLCEKQYYIEKYQYHSFISDSPGASSSFVILSPILTGLTNNMLDTTHTAVFGIKTRRRTL